MSETEEGITGAELEEGREAIVEQTRDTVVAAGS